MRSLNIKSLNKFIPEINAGRRFSVALLYSDSILGAPTLLSGLVNTSS